jgi:hypothetical protein
MTSSSPAPALSPVRSQGLRAMCSFPAMLVALFGVYIYKFVRGAVDEPDIWWHLRNVEYLFQNRRFPGEDMYTFTVAGHSWLNHQWLAEIPYYLSWKLGGLVGIEILTILLVELLFAGLLYLCYQASGNVKAAIIACGFASLLMAVTIGPRTALFGYAHLLLLLIVLERFRERGGPLWPIPLIFCSWINMHGLWLMGLVVFGVIAAAGMVEGTWGRIVSRRWTPSERRRLIWTGLASIGALFVNPFGWRLVYYPFNFALEQKLVKSNIEEWASVNFHAFYGKVALITIAAFLVAALVRNRSWRLSDVALLLLGFYWGLTHIRLLVALGVLGAPIIARSLDFIPPYNPEADRPAFNILIVAMVVLGVLFFLPPMSQPELEDLVAENYPVAIQPYLKANPPEGPVLNYYMWGGYFVWHNREMKVFIDGRADIFEYAGVMQEYLDLLRLKNMDAIFDKYGIRYVMFPPGQPLTHALERDSQWKENYRDKVIVMFEKRGESR